MNRDTVFDREEDRASDFEFNEEVAAVFDDMLNRSVPFYSEQQSLLLQIASRFSVPGTRAYDLGCSTGTTLVNLAKTLGPDVRLIGYDNSPPMIEKAKSNLARAGVADRVEVRVSDFNQDLSATELDNASLVSLCWTLQFVRPLRRDRFVQWIHRGLVKGGVLVCLEKVLTNNSDMNRYFIEFYYDFKRRNGYSETEILRKREALENVLVPYRIDENLELFRRNGFHTVETCFQWCNFAGFLCVKSC